MPTGYTAGILNGTIKDFKAFATQCIRNFGAALHMRDDKFDKKFEPRVPDNYHLERLNEEKAKLEAYKLKSDEEVIANRKKNLEEEIDRCNNAIKEKQKNYNKLSSILADAQLYVPPTEEHKEYKNFMIDQLQNTMKWDCNTEYYKKAIEELEKELQNVDVQKIREEEIASIENDIKYSQERYNEELESCNKSNKWAEDVFNSLK
jgi:hypothetical protein